MARRLMLFLSPLPLIALVVTFSACGLGKTPVDADTLELTIAGRDFTLELALDRESRYQGLSDRPSIADDGGMLFAFPDAQVRTFVMRRCLVPIDIVFLSPTGRVLAMHEMQLEPYDTPENDLRRYSSHWPAQFAIEFKAGTIEALGMEEGQKIGLPLERLKGRTR